MTSYWSWLCYGFEFCERESEKFDYYYFLMCYSENFFETALDYNVEEEVVEVDIEVVLVGKMATDFS